MEVFAWPASNGRSHPVSSSVPRNCRLCSCPIQQPPPLPCKQQPHEDPLCLTKDLKDSLNALQQAERSPPRQPSPDNRWLEEERLFLRGACWSAASNSMSCLQLSNSILQMTAASCGKTSSSSAPDEASSVRQLLLSGGSSSSSLGSSSAPDSGYGLPFCMDDDQLPSQDDEQAAVAPPEAALTFHLTDGGTQRVVVEENLRCIDLCHLLSLKLNVARSQTWTLVERIGQPRIERSLEDHEEVLQVYASWAKNKELSGNKFYFRQDFRKYEFFNSPLQFFSLDMVDLGSQLDCLAESTELAKLITLQNILNQGERCPVVHSLLWYREPGKQSWKQSYFRVEGTELLILPPGQKESWQLQPVANLKDWNVYVPYDKNQSGPTAFQFCLKPTRSIGPGSSGDLMWFCSGTEQQRQCWIIALRLAKFGKKLRENYKELRSRYSEHAWAPEPGRDPMSSPWVAMDFTGSKGRVIEDPQEAEAVAAAEAQVWKRKLPCCRSGQASPTAVQQQQQLQSGPPHWAGGGGGGPAADLGLQHMQPWFYRGMSREEATQLLLKHGTVDGVFLVRQSLTKPGSYVLCYVYRGKVHHVQIISLEDKDQLCYSLDAGRTKFYDLLQLVEFYQLNLSCLPTKLTHFLVHQPRRKDTPPSSSSSPSMPSPFN